MQKTLKFVTPGIALNTPTISVLNAARLALPFWVNKRVYMEASFNEQPLNARAISELHHQVPKSVTTQSGTAYKKTAPALLTVISTELLAEHLHTNVPVPYTEETRHIVLDLAGYDDIFYPPGYSVGIVPFDASLGDFNPKLFRLYSIASSLAQVEVSGKRTLSLCVTRVIGPHQEKPEELFKGLCSNYACDLKAGDSVRITGPIGTSHYQLPENAGAYNYIFIGNGTGIAPLRAMLQELDATGQITPAQAIWVFFGFRKPEHFLKYQAEFAALQTQYPNVFYRAAISRPSDGTQKLFVQDALWLENKHVASLLPLNNTRIYLCGGKSMKDGVDEVLRKIGAEIEMDVTPLFEKHNQRYLTEVY